MLGTSLHGSIAVTMGLWSFMFAMFAGLLLLTVPFGASAYTDRFTFRSACYVFRINRFMSRGEDHGPAQYQLRKTAPSVS